MSDVQTRPAVPDGPRDRLVQSAAQLIRRQGVTGTGMREIVADADAPRGSLQHYFPDGKVQLVTEALALMGGVAARRAERALARLETRSPSALLDGVVEYWRRDLTREDFAAGCPLVATAADAASTSEPLREVVGRAFSQWQASLTEGLAELGVPATRAPSLALLVISALEGAIILARVQRDLTPLDNLVIELGPLLDAAATTEGTSQ